MEPSETDTLSTRDKLPKDILLIVFVHGFKGTDETFHSFPSRLQHVLSESIENLLVESIIFPAYETKGELDKAVERFADWLTTITVEKEVAHGSGGGAGKAKIVLCGHSMGGLLIADTLLAIIHNRPDARAPVWPNIIACLAFDTPYLGLHPHVFKNSATKALGYVQGAHKVATDVWDAFSSFNKAKASAAGAQPAGLLTAPSADAGAATGGWSRWAPAAAYSVGGALLAGAAAGTAFYKKDEVASGYTYFQDHMKYVGNLWNEKQLQERVECLLQAEQEHSIAFRTYYTLIPADMRTHFTDRTFVVLPRSAEAASHFEQSRNSLAIDEVTAHIGMFEASTNDGYYQLGLAVASVIRNSLTRRRGAGETRLENVGEVIKHSAEFSKAAAEESGSANNVDFLANPWADEAKQTADEHQEDLLA